MGVNSRQPVRSVSLPCRSHPRTDKMDKLLNMFKSTWELTSNPSAEIIFSDIQSIKQVESIICSCPFMVSKEVAECNTVIFRFLLEFLAVPLLKTHRKCRWKAVSIFLSSGKVLPEEISYTHVNEFQTLDDALLRCSTSEKHEFIQLLPNKLEALEATLEGIDSHLQLLSRRLIATRVSLLNMVSFY
ncbi:uncharacterized protein LOC143567074 [Bidens hawaiensis]|uniref:uncharacterized protein LOC143567074 n=1 Tax=Bidens hawaiensis TaxID=980011 RepID=UPI004049DBAA